MSNSSNPLTPKINQRMLLRTAILLFALAGLFFGYQQFTKVKDDFQGSFGKADTKGLVAAIQQTDDGQRIVTVGADGTIKTPAGGNAETTDRDLVWRPDGNFLFFCSNREENAFHVLRWNPTRTDAEVRTVGKRGRSNPTFAPDASSGDERLLMVSGGNVLELDPKQKLTPQILPPTSAEVTTTGEEKGTEGLFASIYKELGESFRIARYLPGRDYIAAIMRRTDGGETLIIQDMRPNEKGQLRPPLPLAAGEQIHFDLSAKSTKIVFSVQGFRWPRADQVPKQFVKGNRITVPYESVVAIYDPAATAPPIPIAIGQPGTGSFGNIALSPDGETLLGIVGEYKRGEGLLARALVTLPCRENGMEARSVLKEGDIADPTWSLDGTRVAFTLLNEGKRDIITMTKDGTEEKNLTQGKGYFSQPRFSPQG